MYWINNFLENIGLDPCFKFAFVSQLVCTIPLLYFGIKSILTFKKEIVSEHNQQGAIPILAIVYTLISCWYCFLFISNFDILFRLCQNKVTDQLSVFDNASLHTNSILLLVSCSLVAFSFNFSKSLYTLNCLEFGLINKYSLKEVFVKNNFKALLEGFIRIFISFLFIYLEKILGTSNYDNLKVTNIDVFIWQEPTFLKDIGSIISILYLLLIIWVGIIFIFDKSKVIPRKWFYLNLIQFLSGIIVGLSILFLGIDYNIIKGYKELVLLIAPIGTFFSILLIIVILLLEIPRKKNGDIQLAY